MRSWPMLSGHKTLNERGSDRGGSLGAVASSNTHPCPPLFQRELHCQLEKVSLLMGPCKQELAELGVEGEALAQLSVEAELGVVALAS